MSDSVRDTDKDENGTRREYLRAAALGGTVVAGLATSDMEPTSNMKPMSGSEYRVIQQSEYRDLVENADVAYDSSLEGIRLENISLDYVAGGNVSEEKFGVLGFLMNYLNDGEDALLYSIEDSSDNKIDDGYIPISNIRGEDGFRGIDPEDAEFVDSVSVEGSVKRTAEYGDDSYAFQIDSIDKI